MSDDTSQYPNSVELRDWAMAINPRAVAMRGGLPNAVIVAWNKAHPDRPYVKSEGYHGTVRGYLERGCRCDRCSFAGHEHRRQDYEYARDNPAS